MTQPKIQCPACGEYISKVIDTRGAKRVRRCVSCQQKFPTKEVLADEAEDQPYRSPEKFTSP